MKRLYRPSVEELNAIPDDEGVEVVGGIPVRWVDDKVHLNGCDLVVPLPAGVRKTFRPKEGEVLRARGRNGEVVVRRAPRTRAHRAARP